MEPRIRTLVQVEGVVQGVGFRPFVYSLATRLGLAGHVGNDAAGVFIEIEGPPPRVLDFLVSLEHDAPPLARIETVRTTALAPSSGAGFSIVASEPGGRRQALISADTATCGDCLNELADPADRRFGYPFINCTNCGPRFTIVRDVPYDRPLTTMAKPAPLLGASAVVRTVSILASGGASCSSDVRKSRTRGGGPSISMNTPAESLPTWPASPSLVASE